MAMVDGGWWHDLCAGPVGFSDAIGQTNATLIRRTCTTNGTLLKPSKPLTTIDRLLLLGEDGGDAPNVVASYDGESFAVRSKQPPAILTSCCLLASTRTHVFSCLFVWLSVWVCRNPFAVGTW
jgi:hypothetical protein